MHNDPKALGADFSDYDKNRSSIRSSTSKFVRDNRQWLEYISRQSGVDVTSLETVSRHPYGCVFGKDGESFSLTQRGWPGLASGAVLTPNESLLQYDRLKGTRAESLEALSALENQRTIVSGYIRRPASYARFGLDHTSVVVSGCGRDFDDVDIVGWPLVEFMGHPYALNGGGDFSDILKLTEMGWSVMISPHSEYSKGAFKVTMSRRIRYTYAEAGEIDRYTWGTDFSDLKDEQFYLSKTMGVMGVLDGSALLVHHPLIDRHPLFDGELYSVLGHGPDSNFPLWDSMTSPEQMHSVPALELHLNGVGMADLVPASDEMRSDYLSGDYFG